VSHYSFYFTKETQQASGDVALHEGSTRRREVEKDTIMVVGGDGATTRWTVLETVRRTNVAAQSRRSSSCCETR
jgi:uncharacterized cupin superfamily protein